jgi:16S rRNA (guanine966-N2)-methyltransferase
MHRIDRFRRLFRQYVHLMQPVAEISYQIQQIDHIGRGAQTNPPSETDVADAGRVIAGTARGIRLEAPGPRTRPLGDRVKQTLFAVLEPDLPGARVLDLFAGSGAAGIEALSRGAGHATFVERDPGATRVIATNLDRAHLGGDRANVVTGDALSWLRRTAAGATGLSYDVVFLDPPYAETGMLTAALEGLGTHLAPGARVVAKHFWRDRPPATIGLLASERERRFGETALTFYRRQEDR